MHRIAAGAGATLVLVVSVFGFYLATLAPSLNWADGARMQLDVMFGGSTYWSFEEAEQVPTDGLPFDRLGAAAWDHPLYVMLAQAFLALPFGEPLYRINLMSAVFGALAIGVVFQIGLLITDPPDRRAVMRFPTQSVGNRVDRAWETGEAGGRGWRRWEPFRWRWRIRSGSTR